MRIRIRKCEETTQSVGAVFPRGAWEQENLDEAVIKDGFHSRKEIYIAK
jgi:hypothetical protein